jgi:hypothetical protein
LRQGYACPSSPRRRRRAGRNRRGNPASTSGAPKQRQFLRVSLIGVTAFMQVRFGKQIKARRCEAGRYTYAVPNSALLYICTIGGSLAASRQLYQKSDDERSEPGSIRRAECSASSRKEKQPSERRVGRKAGTHTRFANLSSDSPDHRYGVREPSLATLKSKQVASGWRT